MGGLRTLAFGLALALPAGSCAVCAEAGALSDPLHLFATCTGRLSALMEYQWLVQDPDSDRTERLRDQMADLLQAIEPKDQAARVMEWRLEAKVAEAALLRRSLTRDSPAALNTARQQVAACTALLVS